MNTRFWFKICPAPILLFEMIESPKLSYDDTRHGDGGGGTAAAPSTKNSSCRPLICKLFASLSGFDFVERQRCGAATQLIIVTKLQGSILNFGVIFPVLRGHFYHIRYQYAVS